jgi:hypothetical protein
MACRQLVRNFSLLQKATNFQYCYVTLPFFPSPLKNFCSHHHHHPNPSILHQNNHRITIIKLSMSSLEWAKQKPSSKIHSHSNLCRNLPSPKSSIIFIFIQISWESTCELAFRAPKSGITLEEDSNLLK